MSTWSVGFPSDLKVVGYNPENADLDRPRGEIIRPVFFVVAEDAQGYRRTWGGSFKSEAAAESAYLYLAPPVFSWDVDRPCYGSEAYARNWRKYEADQIAREKDDDEFQRLAGEGRRSHV